MDIVYMPSRSEETFSVRVKGDEIMVTVTADYKVINKWLGSITYGSNVTCADRFYGVDCEWTLDRFGRPNRVSILSICHGSRVLVYQIGLAPFVPKSMYSFFENSKNVFTGVGVVQDLSKLNHNYGLKFRGSTVDLRDHAALRLYDSKYTSYGLASLSEEIFGFRPEKLKRITLSCWSNFRLNLEQVKYAAIDAYLSHCIYYGIEKCSESFMIVNDVVESVFDSDAHSRFSQEIKDISSDTVQAFSASQAIKGLLQISEGSAVDMEID